MKSLWNDTDANRFGGDPLGLRVYTSRLLGQDTSLVLHGGGNTSVKANGRDLLGHEQELLYVKGSGWDLATIERAGFAPVRIDVLHEVAQLPSVSDSDLVRVQRSALIDPSAPDPSVEAVLHAIIPATYVDHTHADVVVALSNTPNGEADLQAIFGDRMLIVPYVMPGFALAHAVRNMSQGIDWSRCDGMILLHHGVFTWGETARASYESMIRVVSRVEEFLDGRGAFDAVKRAVSREEDLGRLSKLRRAVSDVAGRPMVTVMDDSDVAAGFAGLPNVASIATRGPLTPDHVIRTKNVPVLIGEDADGDVQGFVIGYRDYFARWSDGTQRRVDPAPRWAVWPGHGVVSFGSTRSQARIVADIASHTIAAIQWAEALGGWRALPERDVFAVEYWELEQAKLTRGGSGRAFEGRVAIVSGAAGGIGRAIATELAGQGAAVVTVDVRSAEEIPGGQSTHIEADVTDPDAAQRVVEEAVRCFGGLDILVSNAGMFPASQPIESIETAAWDRTLDVNLTSHQRMLKAAIPFLRHGVDPSIVFVGSKNVPAPGPGQAAYSVSKAGLTQLARVAALELGADGIRVNVVHPNAVFDTGFWTDDVLSARAAAYDMTVDEYKRSNVLGAEVTSKQVAAVVLALASPAFSRTTGAQIPVDGGNDRVI
jgi:rhamnose utilization protein RhaD (predicted bifunctional aldolase and dehydrogenase)/NAD(P)-dependent dehydrogenase (short-subunit alcohol dehydrogenase family)